MFTPERGVNMGALLWLAALLVAIWIVLAIFVKLAGVGVHLLLFAAAIALIAWSVRRTTGGTTRTGQP